MKDYLPGLNTVRVYAAFCVLYVHVAGVSQTPVIMSGWNAVTLFFTLSGFLITYRLLREKQATKRINLKAFYIRREARILPLYYLVLFICLFFLPLLGVKPIEPLPALLAIVLLPQVAYGLVGITSLGAASVLWSIGVEELFYIIFPFLMRRFNFVRLCLLIIVVSTVLDGLISAGASDSVRFFVKFMRFECMAVGALMAWLVVTRSRWLFVLYHPAVQLATIALLVLAVVCDLILPLNDLFFSIVVAVVLINISTNPSSVLKLEFRWSRPLGELTYGIYLWHLPITFVLQQYLSGWTLMLLVLVLTLMIAWCSYQFIEKPITRLRMKRGSSNALQATV